MIGSYIKNAMQHPAVGTGAGALIGYHAMSGSLFAGLLMAGTANGQRKDDGFRPLFDGHSLNGWTRKERDLKNPSLGSWTVQDGVLIGGQDPPGSGIAAPLR